MIENPKPLMLTLPESLKDVTLKGPGYAVCKYYNQGFLLCISPRSWCPECYMYQRNLDDQATMFMGDKDRPIHLCDKCHNDILLLDKIVYVKLFERSGELIGNLELCYDCAEKLTEWLVSDEDKSE